MIHLLMEPNNVTMLIIYIVIVINFKMVMSNKYFTYVTTTLQPECVHYLLN